MRRFLIVCALVAGCGGGSEAAPAVHTAPPQPRSSVEVSLHGPDTRRVVFGHPLELKGRVKQSHPTGPAKVRLLASHEPVQTTTTGEGGSFRFTVRPEVNTIYSVSVGDKVSRHIQVYAMPDQSFRVEPVGPRSGVFILEIKHPLSVTPTDRPALFYVHFADGGRVYERVARAHLDHVSAVRAVARVKVTVPRPADDAVACVPVMIAANFGDPPLSDCGQRRVRVPRRH